MGRGFKLLLSIACLFICLSAYRLLFQGVLEVPSYEAEHRDAGAGDYGLLLQLALAVAGFAIGVFACWSERRSNARIKATCVAITLLFPILFLFMARGLQRFGSGFSHERWEVLERLPPQSKRALNSTNVIQALGDPLIRKQHPNGTETWIYSYMPSCGLGWDKKYVGFDARGNVTELFTASEP